MRDPATANATCPPEGLVPADGGQAQNPELAAFEAGEWVDEPAQPGAQEQRALPLRFIRPMAYLSIAARTGGKRETGLRSGEQARVEDVRIERVHVSALHVLVEADGWL